MCVSFPKKKTNVAPELVAGIVKIKVANLATCGRLSDRPVDLRYIQISWTFPLWNSVDEYTIVSSVFNMEKSKYSPYESFNEFIEFVGNWVMKCSNFEKSNNENNFNLKTSENLSLVFVISTSMISKNSRW